MYSLISRAWFSCSFFHFRPNMPIRHFYLLLNRYWVSPSTTRSALPIYSPLRISEYITARMDGFTPFVIYLFI